MTAKQIATLLQLRVSWGGVHRLVELRVPHARQIVPLILPAEKRTPDALNSRMPTEIQAVVATVDGTPMNRELAESIWAEPAAAATILAARGRAFSALAEQGHVYALCPHCRTRETKLSVFALVAGLDDGPWPIIDNDGCIAEPSLATLRPRAARPDDRVVAARIRATLPSVDTALGGPIRSTVLGDITPELDAAAWRTWAPPHVDPPAEHFYWRYQHAGFRVLLRLSVVALDAEGVPEVTPYTIEALPAIDFFFLDNVYYLTHNVAVGARQFDIRCDTCGGIFLPVR